MDLRDDPDVGKPVDAVVDVAIARVDASDTSPDTSPALSPDAADRRPDAAAPDVARAIDQAADVAPDAVLLTCTAGLPYPDQLGCTGLYSDWPSRTVDPAVREYRPGFELWSDGAAKTRWIYLPAGQKIDVSKPNEWTFPVGTKVWKEFRLLVAGKMRRIETRYFWKKSLDEWARAVYVWNADESQAPEVKAGIAKVAGTDYEIPPQLACVKCHGGRLDSILGFEAVSLAAPGAQGFTYADLQSGGWLKSTNGKETIPASALVPPGDADAQRSLGYLHANCGVSCHNRNSAGVKFMARLEINSAGTLGVLGDTGVFQLAINQVSDFLPPNAVKGFFYRIRPTDPSRSTFSYLSGRRDPVPDGRNQMPPLASHKVDVDAVAALDAWITGMTVDKGYPAPAP